MPEYRAGCEFRAVGRTLTGSALRYGDTSPEHRERFEPGAFVPVPDVPMNLQHDRSMLLLGPGEYALTDSDSALEVRAELPADSAALKLVRRGALNGFSVEFHSRSERQEFGVRVIERAELVGIALVDAPSYPASTAEVRRRGDRGGRLGTLRGRIPAGKAVDCRCLGKDCKRALFEQGSFDDLEGDPADWADDVLAVTGDYSQGIASAKRGNLRFWKAQNGDLEFALDIPNTARGEALLETMESVPVFARPSLDAGESVFEIADGIATYKRAKTRAFTVGPTDKVGGWTALAMGKDGETEPRAAVALPRRRPLWL